MAVREIKKTEEFNFNQFYYTGTGIDVGHICYPDTHLGLKIGDSLPSGEIVQLCVHPESGCAWVIVKTTTGHVYEVDVPYK